MSAVQAPQARCRRGLLANCTDSAGRLNGAVMPKVDEYRGKKITVFFDSRKCIHSRHCVLTLPDVFRANTAGPWIVPDDADPEELVEVAHSCPSGAISYTRHDHDKQETVPQINIIRVLENGPLAVHAELKLAGQTPLFRATLCRCGASKNKPFCDNSHRDAGFFASGEPGTLPSEPLEIRNGPLEITPTPNGPFVVKGNVEICTGTRRTILRTQRTALCRCGASNNKPFCDGSHAVIGFKTE
jgi:CDGSH-type Zn-finger protein/uncharacterized Fe-S cluster protein YjdI